MKKALICGISGQDGAYLAPNLNNNVFETIVMPMPQFYTAKYQVTIWTQYTQHSNQIMEKIFSDVKTNTASTNNRDFFADRFLV